jgi:hypothetical protein
MPRFMLPVIPTRQREAKLGHGTLLARRYDASLIRLSRECVLLPNGLCGFGNQIGRRGINLLEQSFDIRGSHRIYV